MDIDVTEPIPVVAASTPGRSVRPAIMVAGAALAVLLAAVAALAWTFSDDSKQAAKPKAIAAMPSKAPAAAKPAEPSAPAKPGDPAGGLAGGLDPAALFGGGSAAGLTSNPAFSSAGAPTYGRAGTPTSGLVKPPNVQWPELGWQDVAPAMALGLSGGDIANIVGDVGNWVYGAAVTTANDSVDLVQTSGNLIGDLLLYDAYIRNGTSGASSLQSLVSSAAAAGMNPATALSEAVKSVSNATLVNPVADTASTLTTLSEAVTNLPSVQMPDAASLGSVVKMPEIPSLGSMPKLSSGGLPSLNALPDMSSLGTLQGLPKIELPGIPQAPDFGLSKLPSPGQLGLDAAVASAMPSLGVPQMPSLDFLQKLPPPMLPKMGAPKFELPKFGFGLPRPPRLGLSVPSITRLMGLPF